MSDTLAYRRGAAADLPPSDRNDHVQMAVLKTLHDRLDGETARAYAVAPLRDLTGLVMADAMTADAAARKGRRDVAEAMLTEVAVNAIHALVQLRRGRT